MRPGRTLPHFPEQGFKHETRENITPLSGAGLQTWDQGEYSVAPPRRKSLVINKNKFNKFKPSKTTIRWFHILLIITFLVDKDKIKI